MQATSLGLGQCHCLADAGNTDVSEPICFSGILRILPTPRQVPKERPWASTNRRTGAAVGTRCAYLIQCAEAISSVHPLWEWPVAMVKMEASQAFASEVRNAIAAYLL